MAFTKNRILNGTEGKVYIDGEPVYNVDRIDVKVSIDYDDINLNGEYVTQHRYMGASISGTVSLHKFDSYLVELYAQHIARGTIPPVRIDVALYDPQTQQRQIVALYDVQFEEVDLGSFTNKELLTEDMPFNAGSFEVLEVISE